MSTPRQEHDIEFGGPATYRIVVQGSLSPEWASRLAGMELTTASRGDQAVHSTLEGPILDQAELSGVLDTLYGLHLPILKVEKLEEELQES